MNTTSIWQSYTKSRTITLIWRHTQVNLTSHTRYSLLLCNILLVWPSHLWLRTQCIFTLLSLVKPTRERSENKLPSHEILTSSLEFILRKAFGKLVCELVVSTNTQYLDFKIIHFRTEEVVGNSNMFRPRRHFWEGSELETRFIIFINFGLRNRFVLMYDSILWLELKLVQGVMM